MKKKRKRINSVVLAFFIFLVACNPDSLSGKYVLYSIEGDTSKHTHITTIELKKDKTVIVTYHDTTLTGSWKESDIKEFHFAEVSVNGHISQFIRPSEDRHKLAFSGQAIDFRNNYYNNAVFILSKQE